MSSVISITDMFDIDRVVPLPPARVCALKAFVLSDVIINVKLPLLETLLLNELPTVTLTLPLT